MLAARASEYEADLPVRAVDRGARPPARRGRRAPAARGSGSPTRRRWRACCRRWPSAPSARSRPTATARTARCATCSSGWRPCGRSSLCLDDVHWADPGSGEALAALVHRPPAGAVLLAVSRARGAAGRRRSRSRSPPPSASSARRGWRSPRSAPPRPTSSSAPTPAPSTATAAATRSTSSSSPAGAARQRAGSRPGGRRHGPARRGGGACRRAERRDALMRGGCSTPRPWSATRSARGSRPRSPSCPEAVALSALDELLARALVRPGAAPRRFAFRHPVVRHAVYVATPGGWRLGAHARAAEALERRGAGAVERAHHVEQAAARGDEAAIALLGAAAQRAAVARARDGGALPRRDAAAAARRLGRAHRGPEPAGRGAGRRGRRRRRPRDAARRAADGGSRRPPRPHRRRGQLGVVDGATPRRRGSGCTSRSACCRRARPRTASASGSRSR